MKGNNPHESRSTAAARRQREMERKKTERKRERERERERAGEIACERRKLQTRKLSSSYYLRRDRGPASRELSGTPRSLNTPPSARPIVRDENCSAKLKRERSVYRVDVRLEFVANGSPSAHRALLPSILNVRSFFFGLNRTSSDAEISAEILFTETHLVNRRVSSRSDLRCTHTCTKKTSERTI